MKKLILTLSLALIFAAPVGAQTLQQTPKEKPEMPKALASAEADGAQVMYLGEFQGLYGWALIRQGRPEFYYATKDNSALVMGLLFDAEGEMITNGQLAQLRANEGDDMFAMTGGLDDVNNSPKSTAPTTNVVETSGRVDTGLATTIAPESLTPAQEMFVDVMAANWLTFGPNGKYEIFAFIDPDCPHCQRFIADSKPLVDNGTLKIRALPIGIDPSSERKAALMLAGSNPMDRFLRYANGDQDALNAPANINVEGVQKNKSVLTSWGFDVTPIIVYKSGGGDIRVIRGRPKSMEDLIRDLSS